MVATDERGHLHRKGELSYGLHTANLIDLVLADAFVVQDFTAVATGAEPVLHPFVQGVWSRLASRLPLHVQACFFKDIDRIEKLIRVTRRAAAQEEPIAEAAERAS